MGAKLTVSVQLDPGAIGETILQFCVPEYGAEVLTAVTFSGAVPVFVTVTVWLVVAVPTGCALKLREEGDTDAAGADADPANTYVTPSC
jgi:hypothetical protein